MLGRLVEDEEKMMTLKKSEILIEIEDAAVRLSEFGSEFEVTESAWLVPPNRVFCFEELHRLTGHSTGHHRRSRWTRELSCVPVELVLALAAVSMACNHLRKFQEKLLNFLQSTFFQSQTKLHGTLEAVEEFLKFFYIFHFFAFP